MIGEFPVDGIQLPEVYSNFKDRRHPNKRSMDVRVVIFEARVGLLLIAPSGALPILPPVFVLREGLAGCCVLDLYRNVVQLRVVKLPGLAWRFDLF